MQCCHGFPVNSEASISHDEISNSHHTTDLFVLTNSKTNCQITFLQSDNACNCTNVYYHFLNRYNFTDSIAPIAFMSVEMHLCFNEKIVLFVDQLTSGIYTLNFTVSRNENCQGFFRTIDLVQNHKIANFCFRRRSVLFD